MGGKATGGDVEVGLPLEFGGGGDPQIPITGRAGAIVMRSVSIFLASGRKVSVASRRQQPSSSGAVVNRHPETRVRRLRRMPDDLVIKNAAYHIKVVELLKKRTNFSKTELEALCKIYSKLTSNPCTRSGTNVNNGSSAPLQAVEGIDRTIFRELLHNTFNVLTEEALIERMFSCWDKHSEGTIRMEPWIMGLDIFLRGSLREKIEFCFRVYDLNSDGFITKDEIFQLLNTRIGNQEKIYNMAPSVEPLSLNGPDFYSQMTKALLSRHHIKKIRLTTRRVRKEFSYVNLTTDVTRKSFLRTLLAVRNCLMKQPGEEDPEEGVRDLSEMALKKLDADHDGKVSFSDYESTIEEEPLLLEAFGQVLPTPESVAAFLLTLKCN